MKTIYKYTFHREATIQMFKGAKIFSTVRSDNVNNISVWALVDTDQPLEPVHFEVLGTQWPHYKNYEYIGTCFNDPFEWHVMRALDDQPAA